MSTSKLDKWKSSINRGVTTLNVKTTSSLEKMKINTHIESLEQEVQKMYQMSGEKAYATWKSDSQDYFVLEETFKVIEQKKEEIQRLKEEIIAIDEKNKEILGVGDSEVEKDMIVCQNCGMQSVNTARFCRKCGTQLKE